MFHIKKVEQRIGMPLKEMDQEDFSIPGILPSPLGGKSVMRSPFGPKWCVISGICWLYINMYPPKKETAGSKKSKQVAEPVSRRAKAAKTQVAQLCSIFLPFPLLNCCKLRYATPNKIRKHEPTDTGTCS